LREIDNSYRFGPFRIDLKLACLRRDEVPVVLRPQSFDVLVYLVRNAGRVVSKDELFREVWPGSVVTDNSLVQCIKEIREALGPEGQAMVTTSARRGYAFVPPSAPTTGPPQFSRRNRFATIALALALVAGAAAAWLAMRPAGTPAAAAPTPPLSVAVVPFATPQGVDYFSSGLSADIAGALGRFPELSVASPDVVSRLSAAGASVEDVKRQFNARYLVEGDVARSPGSVRVAVRLTDLPRATLLWSETYDVPAADVPSIRDAIATKVAGALAVKVVHAEQRRTAAKPPGSLEAYDFVLRGREGMTRLNRTAQSQARAAFERAIAIDPGYAAAYVGLGRVDLTAIAMGWTADPEAALRHAQDAALRAISLDEFDARAHVLLGRTYTRMGEYDRAVEKLRRAVFLNRSEPDSYAGLGDALLWSGDPRGAAEALEAALAMDPRLSAEDLFDLGAAYLLEGRAADAIRTLERATQRKEGNPFIYAVLAGAYAQAGRAAEAREAASQVRRMDPLFDLAEFGSLFRKPEHRAKLTAAIQAAGV
jgi:DNA-binding winged helix-turn-helix (wHTH) protein/TolB-like protein/Tfp pilus assembly protein PilF